jgi:predicted ATPase
MSASIFPPESNVSIPVDDAAFEPLPSGPMDLRQFLRTAIRITSALAQLHAKDTIHRNIRPQNIRIHGPSGHVKLLGQAGAYVVRDPQREAAEAAEALPYMSPEQTEEMKRPMDHRSDLYSLGVVFYSMLCGRLPFQAEDPIGWVQAHLTLEPPPVTAVSPETPQAVSDVISKLLRKTVEERYQSARGLLLDLETCLVELRAKGYIEPFPLGARDVWHGLRISAKLYGRENEAVALFASFERVVNTGKPEIALVSGYSGIGKTSVVMALHKPIVRERGFFLSGKFDQHKRNIPYVTISQAFRDLVRQILTERTSQIELWRKRILDALGLNAQLVVDIVPQLEELIGKQPPVPELPINQATIRFNTVFRSFLGVFAKREHPVVLFLDDLQYADFASLALLSDVITHPETRHVLVLGAYRDNEVSPSHPAIMTLDEITKNGVVPKSIVLKPLEIEHLTQLVADTFRFEPENARPLAGLLHKKTGGNPFFANQFLAELHHENLVRFDVDNSSWQWNIAEIETKEFTDDVVELMASKLRRLPGETQAALQLAACIGNEFDVEMLQVTHDKTPEETYEDLDPSVRGEFMLRRGNIYKFMHDRVHQAAYSLIPQEQVNWVHLRIGRLLLERTTETERDERVFDIVNQFNIGKVYITETDEQRSVAELNLAAGLKAKASVAYRSAATYLGAGISLLPEASWTTDYKLAFDLHVNLSECELLNGEFDEAERLSMIALENASSNADKARAYWVRILNKTIKGQNIEALPLGKECLQLFDINLSIDFEKQNDGSLKVIPPSNDEVVSEMQRIRASLGDRPIEDLLDLPRLADPDKIAAMTTLATLYAPAFFIDQNLTDLLTCRIVEVSILQGNMDASTLGYVTFGQALTARFEAYDDSYRFGKLAYDLVEKYKYSAFKAQVCNVFASLISIWKRHVSMNLEYSWIGWKSAIETGNAFYGAFNSVQTVLAKLLKGDLLENVAKTNDASKDYIESVKYKVIAAVCRSVERFIRNMQGLTTSFSTFGEDGVDIEAFERELKDKKMFPVINFWYHVLKLTARYISGDYDEAMAASKVAEPIVWSARTMATYPEYCFFTAMTTAMLHAGASEEARAQHRDVVTTYVEQLRAWSESCPENYLNKYSLAAAELARIEGRLDDAARLLDQAVRASQSNEFVQIEGLSHEVAARFYLDRGDVEKAHSHLREAHACFRRWGAHGKVKQLEELYPDALQALP